MADATLDDIPGKPEKNNNNEAGKEEDAEKHKLPKETVVKLEGMGFTEKEDKIGLYTKSIDDVNFFWDFRKAKTGSAYASRFMGEGEGFDNIPRDELEQMEEYLILRPGKKPDVEKKKVKETPEKGIRKPDEKPEVKTKAMVPASDKKAEGLLRGSERDIIRLMDVRMQLDSIIDASSDKTKLGEGILWHELVFTRKNKQGKLIKTIHVEPSVEFVDLMAQDMGNVSVKIVEFDTNIIEDPNSHEKYMTYYCVAEATDGLTLTSGLGAAEQIIDFNEIKTKGRTFARTLVTRKACRNAKERLIPLPRKAMVFLIRKKLDEHSKKRKQ